MPWVSRSNPTYLRVYARQRPGDVAWDAVPLTVRGLNKAAGNQPLFCTLNVRSAGFSHTTSVGCEHSRKLGTCWIDLFGSHCKWTFTGMAWTFRCARYRPVWQPRSGQRFPCDLTRWQFNKIDSNFEPSGCQRDTRAESWGDLDWIIPDERIWTWPPTSIMINATWIKAFVTVTVRASAVKIE